MNAAKIPTLIEGLSQLLPGYKHRPGQLHMAEAVAAAVTSKANLVVEGGTGIGKSVAYLVPTILSVVEDGARVLVATSHKPLQDQIAKNDLPLLARLFKTAGYRPFTWTTLKGISNYLCWHSAENEQAAVVRDPLASQAVRYAMTASASFSGDFEDFPMNLPPDTRALISASSEDCLGMRCPHRDRCFGLKVRKLAEKVDVVVTNHALLTLDIKSEGAIIPGAYASYVIDEGHDFEENATRANGLQFTIGSARRFINSEIVKQATVSATLRRENALDTLDRLQTEIFGLFNTRPSQADDENRVVIKTELRYGKELVKDLEHLINLVKNRPPATEEEGARNQRLLKQGQSLIDRLERISANADPNLVYYAERTFFATSRQDPVIKVNGRPIQRGVGAPSYTLYALPIDISDYLKKWFTENQVIVTSATLSDGQNFDFFTKRVGLEKPTTLIVSSPFDYKARVALFLPRLGPISYGEAYNRTLATHMSELLNAAPGRALLLFTSYAMLEGVWRQFTGPLSGNLNPARPLFRQGEAQMQRIMDDFKKTENGVIFGTRSWWQGVDLPGMSMLIIDKLPFPQLNDPLVRARTEEIEQAGGSSFGEFMLPLAIITFRQGFGRLMRQEDDRGVVVVCDERIVQKSYGRRFIKSLPDVRVLPDITALKQFFRDGE